MSTESRRILISCAVLALVICLCLAAVALGGAGLLVARSRSVVPQNTLPPAVAVPQNTLSAPENKVTPGLPPSSTATALAPTDQGQPAVSTPAISADVARQMDAIQQQVIQIRGLQSKNPVNRQLITQAELKQIVTDEFFTDYSPQDAQRDTLVYAAFGLLDPSFDLYKFDHDLYNEQIAGFYDDKTKEMYVVEGEGFTGPERFTYSHEYTHVLQDQNFDIEHGLNVNNATCKVETERCNAIQALMEGDATLLQQDWLTDFGTRQDVEQILQFSQNLKQPVYDSAPDFFKMDFLFPYNQGLSFVQYLYAQGGWQAVDQAYHNPPVSTSQILHPERYPNDTPIQVTLPDLKQTLGSGWSELDHNTLGEWYTYLVLAHGLDPKARLDTNEAQAASQGWAGDAYAVYTNDRDKSTVMVFRTVWDNTSDAGKFTAAFQKYATIRFGNPVTNTAQLSAWDSSQGHTELHTDGTQTTWIFTPNATIASSVWGVLSKNQ